MPILGDTDLTNWMGRTLDGNRAGVAAKMAEGWLMAATRLDPWPADPTTVPQDLWAWCVELAALSYTHNPRQMTQRQAGAVLTAWAPDALARRQQILDAAEKRYNRTGLPVGNFPTAQPWPDRADPWGNQGWVQYL